MGHAHQHLAVTPERVAAVSDHHVVQQQDVALLPGEAEGLGAIAEGKCGAERWLAVLSPESVQEALRDLRNFERRVRLAREYVPSTQYGGPSVLFRCDEIPPELYPEIREMIESDLAMGWRRYATGDIEVLPASGSYGVMFRKHHVDILGQRLRTVLERLDPREE